MLWTSDGPKETDEDQVLIDWLNKYVTARLPQEKNEEELFKLVNTAQRHWEKHTKTCSRIIKHHGRSFTKCRFEFPRPVAGNVLVYNRNEDLIGKQFL